MNAIDKGRNDVTPGVQQFFLVELLHLPQIMEVHQLEHQTAKTLFSQNLRLTSHGKDQMNFKRISSANDGRDGPQPVQ